LIPRGIVPIGALNLMDPNMEGFHPRGIDPTQGIDLRGIDFMGH